MNVNIKFPGWDEQNMLIEKKSEYSDRLDTMQESITKLETAPPVVITEIKQEETIQPKPPESEVVADRLPANVEEPGASVVPEPEQDAAVETVTDGEIIATVENE